MAFVGNENKIPVKNLSNEEDAEKIKEWSERLKAIIPRTEPGSGASMTGTMPTGTTWQTLTAPSKPDHAVGAVIIWLANYDTNVAAHWRMDSGDSTRILDYNQANTNSGFRGSVYFSPGTSTIDVQLSVAPATITTNANPVILEWIY